MKTPTKLKIRNGFIYDESEAIIATLTSNSTEEIEKSIEMGCEAVVAIQEFIDKVNSGKPKLRSSVKELENLLNKYDL